MIGIRARAGTMTISLCVMLTGIGLALPEIAQAHYHREPVGSATLRISGTPAARDVAGTAYSFTPNVSSTSTALSYSVTNKPSWASFSIATGTLSGTPSNTQTGTYSGITISVSNGTTSAALGPFSIIVTAPAAPSVPPPTISGTPATSVAAGMAYAFQPTATGPSGYALTYSVTGLPTWANFSTTTGLLSGTPNRSNVGTFPNIVISVSDGAATTSLSPFAISVNAAPNGTAALTWAAPTQNTDGSTLTDLAGYNVYYGTSATAPGTQVVVANPGATGYTVTGLPSGTYYFAVTAFNSSGTESVPSNIGSKTIP